LATVPAKLPADSIKKSKFAAPHWGESFKPTLAYLPAKLPAELPANHL